MRPAGLPLPATLDIEELVLRVPGLDRAQAAKLAQDVADLLIRELDRGPPVRGVAALGLRVRVPDGASPEEMATAIVRQILEALR